MIPMLPATKEPMATIARAGPALPFLAIWYPSIQVTTLAASPGILTRIEVVEPPYCEPNQTPAIIMRPVSAPYFMVKGSISAMVAVGPKPGNTPTMVPTRAPTKQATRLTRLNELAKPLIN